MSNSSWWGESFVNELTRISEQAEKKLKVRRESTFETSNEESRKEPSAVNAKEETGKVDAAQRPTASRSQTTG